MSVDASPIWMPPSPAVTRPADDINGGLRRGINFFAPVMLPRLAAFPAVLGTTTGNNGTSRSTSTTVTLPGSIAAGDLVIVLINCENNAAQPTTPSGYTQSSQTTGTGTGLSVYYKIAAGGETSVVLSHGNNETVWIAYRIGPAVAPSVGTAVAATTSSPNPPSLTPAGGAKPYLWLAVVAQAGSGAVSSDPANYASETTSTNPGASNLLRVTASLRLLAAATEDPASYSIASSVGTVAQTIAISAT